MKLFHYSGFSLVAANTTIIYGCKNRAICGFFLLPLSKSSRIEKGLFLCALVLSSDIDN